MVEKWIENYLISNDKLVSKRCKKEWFEKNNFISIYEEILRVTSFLTTPTFPQRIWHIKNNLYESYKCKNPQCDNTTNFLTYTTGYSETCCSKCAQLNPSTISKIRSTNNKKYGCDYGLSNKEVIEKKKQTCIKNYGVDNPTKSKFILEKIKTSNKEKYGVDWILQDQDKKENSIIKKYGVKNIQQSDIFKLKTSITRRSIFYDSLLNSDRLKNKVTPLFSKEEYINNGYYSNFKFKCKTCNTEFFDCLEDGDIPRCTTCYKQSSVFEEELYNFIKLQTNLEIKRRFKDLINPYEIDIYIPNINVAIECNGLYWHGEINGGKDKNYHLNKTRLCEKNGIRLIHIFEDEWLFKKDIVKSRIQNLFNNINNKVYARNCTVKSINSKESNTFLEENHIQGKDNSSIKLGLFYNDKLVSVMTFGKLRNALGNKSKQNVYELYRFCSLLNTNIIGSASKLLKHFIDQYNPISIITYADKRWNTGKLYETLKFEKISETIPNYWYYGKGNTYKRYHRYNFVKHTLSKKLNAFDNKLTEWENMKNNGYDRIWDCGSIKFELKLN